MNLWDVYKAKKGGMSESLFAITVGKRLSNAWKKGFNKWDEEWEEGSISGTTGQNTSSTAVIRSKNYIPVLPNTLYYAKNGSLSGNSFSMACRFYDKDKTYIGSLNADGISVYWNVDGSNSHKCMTPSDAYYMRFICPTNYGKTYKNDICINISGEHDGEYVPFDGE